ncbi:DUF3592 domain-containing protein [Chitinophaga pendula]|uniref:DUF3592 domain-containing protein n=1 Tax=Chitinophaga TaxID=79328 RepID=UPI000BAF782A|nr:MULTISPECIES: DUF3592 domain-containing protein [Chitinophaga]ASZ12339.1 hypothetical protein CK934_15910 [Chitinophaga sp. MD30]UCJ10067.1 DUF3592 domain-containing protein [Chitinophaga pendula]
MNNIEYQLKYLLCLIAGIVLLVAGTGSAIATMRFIHKAQRAPGMVVRQNAGPSHVEIQFTTAAGQVVNYPQNGLIYLNHGQEVTVLYDPARPRSTASISNNIALWDCTMGLFLLGGVFTATGLRSFRRRY